MHSQMFLCKEHKLNLSMHAVTLWCILDGVIINPGKQVDGIEENCNYHNENYESFTFGVK